MADRVISWSRHSLGKSKDTRMNTVAEIRPRSGVRDDDPHVEHNSRTSGESVGYPEEDKISVRPIG